MELRDVVSDGRVGVPDASGPSGTPDVVEDAVRALQQLGLDPAEARRRVEKRCTGPDQPLSDLVRAALRG